jgi:HAMP domain-containing protein
MKLWLKFSLIFLAVFGVGLTIAGYICRGFLFENARATVRQQAELMLETTLATRAFTSQQVGPLLQALSAKDKAFHPQQVPGFAAMEHFRYVQRRFPDYSYKEATLNPTNLRDRSVDWEADIIRVFRDDRSRKELSIERDTPTGPMLVLSRPIIAEATCLQCHGVPAAAPVSMVHAYGAVNGFGWKLGEVIGAQIISVPSAVPIRMAEDAFHVLLASLIGLGVAILLTLNVAIYLIIVRPITKLAKMADETSKGTIDGAEIPVKGNDEVSTLARSFNRMQRSLRHAIQMLEK